VPDIAEAATMSEDEEGTDVGAMGCICVGADSSQVEEDLSFVGGPGMIEAVEDQVGAFKWAGGGR
jgi:hypothetical protein